MFFGIIAVVSERKIEADAVVWRQRAGPADDVKAP